MLMLSFRKLIEMCAKELQDVRFRTIRFQYNFHGFDIFVIFVVYITISCYFEDLHT